MGGCFKFQWGVCFSDGGGLYFKWGECPMGGALVLMGGGFEKNCWMGVGATPMPPLLWETLVNIS